MPQQPSGILKRHFAEFSSNGVKGIDNESRFAAPRLSRVGAQRTGVSALERHWRGEDDLETAGY